MCKTWSVYVCLHYVGIGVGGVEIWQFEFGTAQEQQPVVGLGFSLRHVPPCQSGTDVGFVRHKSAYLPSVVVVVVVVKHCGSRAHRRPTGIQLRTVPPAEATARAAVAEDIGQPKLMRPSKEASARVRLSIHEHREVARLVFDDAEETFSYVKPETTETTTVQLIATAYYWYPISSV